MICNEQDMLVSLSATTREQAKKHVYKYTSCGAWIEFTETGIRVGSIVEGCDFDATTYSLNYPFTSEDYGARIEALEKEAAALWDWANVTRDRTGRLNVNGKTDAERGLDAPNFYFEYLHLHEASPCPHGNAGECNACNIAGDFAYDSARESRMFSSR